MKVIFATLLGYTAALHLRAVRDVPRAEAHMNTASAAPPLLNDCMIRVARGEPTERIPLWLFRQAGRHLPEYTAYKKEKGKNFLELLQDPKDVAECTLQPVRRYDLDAAILFSDILVVAEALGIRVEMPGGKGILVPEPLLSPADFDRILLPDSSASAAALVRDKLSHVTDAVTLIRQELKGKVPLIGFSAAPWTLFYYMVGGSSKKNQEEGERWLVDHPADSARLMDTLCTVVIEYMSAQVKSARPGGVWTPDLSAPFAWAQVVAGAQLLQLFEAMGMFITPTSFEAHALPYLRRIVRELKQRHPEIPLMVFPRGAAYALPALQEAGFDVLTLDGSKERSSVRELLPNVCLQGDFDPALLVDGTEQSVREAVNEMLDSLGSERLIANLREGLGGKEDPALVSVFIDAVHSYKPK